MKILLVSDDKNISKEIATKLVFLRKDDIVNITNYSNFERDLNIERPNILLLHENQDKENIIEIIKGLRYAGFSIILLLDKYNPEFLLSCFDVGVDDYILKNADDIEFVLRLIKHIKYNDKNRLLSFKDNILEQLNIFNNSSGFFNWKYAKLAVETLIDINIIKNGTLMAFSVSDNDKQEYNEETMYSSIKSSIRACDIAVLGQGTKCLVFLPNTDVNGAIKVFYKIKELLNFNICAGFSDITNKTFEEFEKEAINALSEAIAVKTEYVVSNPNNNDTTLDNWLDNSANQKNYKIFRQMFNKKLEKVIIPVFYRLQQVYENKLPNTVIEQKIDDNRCCFTIKNDNNRSYIEILYPGFSNIIITTVHDGLNTPENNEINMQLSQITEKELVKIIENFVKEFKS